MLGQARSGKIRILAFTNGQRIPIMPEVPTIAEAGYPSLSLGGTTGFYGWRDMPAALRDRIAVDIRTAARGEGVAERLANIGSLLQVSSPEAFAADLRVQRDRIKAIVTMVKPPQ
jgi:tripartite-type tricarboxylate transporter receptor subunit TctC